MSVGELIKTSRIIICCGAGGVGKTTTSGALAIAAARTGKRVLVLTIDPSKRLAETLGVSRNPKAPVSLSQERLLAAGIRAPGSLEAWMLDPKLVADESVARIVKNPDDVKRLLNNHIYQHVTTMVAGMHEYTAMEALRRFVAEGRYDLVVLDTPPSRHALDFLEAPGRLSRFLDGRIFKMFVPTGETGALRRAAGGIVGRVLAGVLGEQLSSDLSMFFGTFSGVLSVLNRDVTGMREFLGASDVAFLLVTSPSLVALEEAFYFQNKTRELGLPFRGFLLNRSYACAQRKTYPTDETLGPAPTPAARAALPKLQALAEFEQKRIHDDQALLGDLAKRAGEGNFALALPMLASPEAEGTEMPTLVRLADVLSQ